MFRFFNKKSSSARNDWSFVHTDIHSHILSGIDDGAQNIEDSLDLIETMIKHGYKKMIATPHISEDLYPNSKATIIMQRDLLRQKAADLKLDLQIDAAAEYMIDERFVELVKGEEKLLAIHDNRVLVEMSYLLESPFLHTALFALQTHGYLPILAHPERYNFYHNDLEKYDELKEKGCFFQLNTIALSGYYGKNVKKTAEYLLEREMYDYLGSDIHHLKHTRALNSVLDMKILNQLKEYPFLNKKL